VWVQRKREREGQSERERETERDRQTDRQIEGVRQRRGLHLEDQHTADLQADGNVTQVLAGHGDRKRQRKTKRDREK
jgi:hypothetical protein